MSLLPFRTLTLAAGIIRHHHARHRVGLAEAEHRETGPAAATTRVGLTVRANLDPGSYTEGVKVSEEQLVALPLTATTGMATGTAHCAPNRQPRRRPARP
jgi:hypothetical protein